MIRIYSLLLGLLFLAAGVVLCGLLTNWFRYGLSLEGTVVVITTLITVAIVVPVSCISYLRNSGGVLGVGAIAAVIGVIIVLLVYDKAIGGLPRFYLSHVEKSPPETVQTQRGALKYWIEIQNPFSSKHAEFLVVYAGREMRIPIQIFIDSSKGYMSAAKPSDWATLSPTSDPNIAILTLGPFLNGSAQ